MAPGGGRLSSDAGTAPVREMGYSRDEFARVLPAAMRDWRVTGGPDVWRVTATDGKAVATIRIKSLPERVIGALRVPVLAVTIEPQAATLAGEFKRRFDRGFHRGGG